MDKNINKIQVATDATKYFMDRLNSAEMDDCSSQYSEDGVFYTLDNERNLNFFGTNRSGNFPYGYAKYGLALLYSVKETDRNYGLDRDNVIDVVYFNNIDKLFRHVEDMLDVDASFPLKIEKKTYNVLFQSYYETTVECYSLEEAEEMARCIADAFDCGAYDSVEVESVEEY
jgi:hypothetical protein